MQIALGEGRDRGEFLLPGAGEGVAVGLFPMRLRHRGERDRRALHRAQQPHAAFNLAVVEHQARRRDLHGGTPGLGVDQQQRARIAGAFDGVGKLEGMIALPPADGEDLRLRPGLRMDVERPSVAHDQAFRRERLNAGVIGARGDGAFDPGAKQILEHAEQRVLQVDGQRQQPVEESGDRRQVLTQGSVLVGQAQPGGILERLERAAFHLAAEQQHISWRNAARP